MTCPGSPPPCWWEEQRVQPRTSGYQSKTQVLTTHSVTGSDFFKSLVEISSLDYFSFPAQLRWNVASFEANSWFRGIRLQTCLFPPTPREAGITHSGLPLAEGKAGWKGFYPWGCILVMHKSLIGLKYFPNTNCRVNG